MMNIMALAGGIALLIWGIGTGLGSSQFALSVFLTVCGGVLAVMSIVHLILKNVSVKAVTVRAAANVRTVETAHKVDFQQSSFPVSVVILPFTGNILGLWEITVFINRDFTTPYAVDKHGLSIVGNFKPLILTLAWKRRSGRVVYISEEYIVEADGCVKLCVHKTPFAYKLRAKHEGENNCRITEQAVQLSWYDMYCKSRDEISGELLELLRLKNIASMSGLMYYFTERDFGEECGEAENAYLTLEKLLPEGQLENLRGAYLCYQVLRANIRSAMLGCSSVRRYNSHFSAYNSYWKEHISEIIGLTANYFINS